MIYLDHNATTPTRPEVIEAIARSLRDAHANPAAQHKPGRQARKALENARGRIAAVLGASLAGGPQADRVIFTSGGTEANNLAVRGIAAARNQEVGGDTPGHLIVSAIEHPSVLAAAEHLMETGWRLDLLGVNGQGVVRAEELATLLRPETALVSVMLGNHETGALQPVSELARTCREAGVPLHTDAVQAVGKTRVDFGEMGVAAMTVAPHKFQGPVGIGLLLLRHDVSLAPLLLGGHQQDGARPGTESVALALGTAVALECWQAEREEHFERVRTLRDRFESAIKAGYPPLVINSHDADRLPQTSNLAFAGLDAQILLTALDSAGIACSVGSACAAGSTELSPTLQAMHLPDDLLRGSLRFSLGATTTEAEIDEAVGKILGVVRELGGGDGDG